MASTLAEVLGVAAAIVCLCAVLFFNQMETAYRRSLLGTFSIDGLPLKLATAAVAMAFSMYFRHGGAPGESGMSPAATPGQLLFHTAVFAFAAAPLCASHYIDGLHARHQCVKNKRMRGSTFAKMLQTISSRVEESQQSSRGDSQHQ